MRIRGARNLKPVLYGRLSPKSTGGRRVFLQHFTAAAGEVFQDGLRRGACHQGRVKPLSWAGDLRHLRPMQDAPLPPVDKAPAWVGGPQLLRRLPLLLIFVAAVLGAVTLRDDLSFAMLAEHREALLAFRDQHYLGAVLAFLAAYVAIVALSLPGGTIATLTGGFLFGLFPGVLYNVAAAGTGAVLVFLAARTGFGDSLSRKLDAAGGKAGQLRDALRQNEWSVLFLMRLVPFVPFFIANLVPAFVGTSLARFAVSTYLGIIPGALVFTSVGSGLGEVFASGAAPDLGIIFSPGVLLPLLGLAALAAMPMLLRAIRRGAE